MIHYVPDQPPAVEQLAALREAVGWPGMERSMRDPRLQRFFSISAYDGGQLVGYVEVVSNGVTDGYVQDLMVHPALQKQGIGTRLMQMTIDEMKKRNIYMLSVIYGEELLRDYYEKFGFFSMLCGQMELREAE